MSLKLKNNVTNLLMERVAEVGKYRIWQEEIVESLYNLFLELDSLDFLKVRKTKNDDLTIDIVGHNNGKYIRLTFDSFLEFDEESCNINARVNMSASSSVSNSFADTSITYHGNDDNEDISELASEFISKVIAKIAFLIENVEHTV